MINCPHYRETGGGKSLRCQCLPAVILPPAGKPNNPCASCQPAWPNGPPDPNDRTTWTPVLVQLAERHTGPPGKRTMTPAPARAKVPYPTNAPEKCHHALSIVDHHARACQRRWNCELHGQIRCADCQRCGDFEPQ